MFLPKLTKTMKTSNGQDEPYDRQPNPMLEVCLYIAKHGHGIAEQADLDDSHPFWAYIEDAVEIALSQ